MQVQIRQIDGGKLSVTADGMELIIDRDHPSLGKQGFRPVELFLGALGGCMAGTLISFAENQGQIVNGIKVDLTAGLATKPERVESIDILLSFPPNLDQSAIDQLMRVAQHCKIHNTLHQEPHISVVATQSAEATS